MAVIIYHGGIYEHVETPGSRYEVSSSGRMKVGKGWDNCIIYRNMKSRDKQLYYVRTVDNFAERFKLISKPLNLQ